MRKNQLCICGNLKDYRAKQCFTCKNRNQTIHHGADKCSCGSKKCRKSQFCLVCYKSKLDPLLHVCPVCKGFKSHNAIRCNNCFKKTIKPEACICPCCGEFKSYKSKSCLKCFNKEKESKMAAKKDLCKCGKLKDSRSVQCRACRDQEPPEKACKSCQAVYPIEHYHLRTNGRGGFKRRSKCKACERKEAVVYRSQNMEKCKERKKRYDASHPDKVAEWSFRTRIKKMGLDPETVMAYVKSHHGQCEICGVIPSYRKLAVDHCHASNTFRGLLCSNCNLGIGLFKDDINNLQNAICYLTGRNSGEKKNQAP